MDALGEILLGVAAAATIWLLSVSIRPRLRLEPMISDLPGPAGPRYRLKIWNAGLRDAIDVEIDVMLRLPRLIRGFEGNTPSVHLRVQTPLLHFPGRLRSARTRTYRGTPPSSSIPALQAIHRAKEWVRTGGLRANSRIVEVSGPDPAALHANVPLPPALVELLLREPVPLREMLERWPGAYVRVVISSTDRLSSTRALLSTDLRPHDIHARRFPVSYRGFRRRRSTRADSRPLRDGATAGR